MYHCTLGKKIDTLIHNLVCGNRLFEQDAQFSLMQRSVFVVEQVDHHYLNRVVFAHGIIWKCFGPYFFKRWAWNGNTV